MRYRFRFDKEKCVGCYACHVACLDAHYDANDKDAVSRRTIQKIVKDEYEKKVCPGCIHCGKCMEVCPEGAIYRDEDTGFILTRQEKCIGCRACESVCPVGVIHFDGTGQMKKCDGCITRIRDGREPACVRVCCTGAITYEILN